MKSSQFNPVLFVATVILAAITVMNFLALCYTEKLYADYDKRLLLSEQETLKIAAETATVKKEVASSRSALQIRDTFAELSATRYSPQDIMRYALAIEEESSKHGIEPALIMAIIATESNFRNNVVSNKGAIGMMQLLPSTAFYISDKLKHITLKNADELFDPEVNLRIGISYFAYLIKKTGSTKRAIIAYNYGPANTKRAINDRQALPERYVSTVIKNYKRMTASID